MGYGNYLNDGNTPPNYSVYDKYYLGWLEPEVLAKSQTLEIPADGETTYMISRDEQHVAAGPYRTDTVYYIENRQQEGWDAFLPGHGLLIWRVIFDEEDWFDNCPNDYVARYLLVSAKKCHRHTLKEKRNKKFHSLGLEILPHIRLFRTIN